MNLFKKKERAIVIDKKKAYKVLTVDLKGPFQEFQYTIGKKYTCKDFDENKKKDCSYGFYATEIEGILYSFNKQKDNKVFLVEVGGKSVEIDQFKRRYEKIKLILEVPRWELEELLLTESSSLGYDLYHAIFPFNPLFGEPKKVTDREINLLKEWINVGASVGDSVRYSVWNSVRDSVMDSVWDSVEYSVWDSVGSSVRDSVEYSVWASVRASVYAYIISLFPNIKKWKMIDHEEGKNPFQPCIDLWNSGFVASFDGETWRLHSGAQAEIVYEIRKEELND